MAQSAKCATVRIISMARRLFRGRLAVTMARTTAAFCGQARSVGDCGRYAAMAGAINSGAERDVRGALTGVRAGEDDDMAKPHWSWLRVQGASDQVAGVWRQAGRAIPAFFASEGAALGAAALPSGARNAERRCE